MTVGIVQLWLTENIPTDHLVCDGSAVSRTTYSALFAIIGVMYGAGDGSTTFNLPDCRGQFPRCYAGGSTSDPEAASRTNRGDGTTGNVVGTKQSFSNKYHDHAHTFSTGAGIGGAEVNALYTTNTISIQIYVDYSGGNEARPKNIYVIPIIGF